MTHFPRIPVTMQPDLAKSMPLSGTPSTDYRKATEDLALVAGPPKYEFPPDRVCGNEVFRRHPNGAIDMANAVNVVTAALNQLKFGHFLNDLESSILLGCFPEAVAPLMPSVDVAAERAAMRIKLRVSDQELAAISMHVAVKLMEMHEWLTFAIRV